MMITRSKRKTVKTDELKLHVNEMLRTSTCSPDTRQGMMTVLVECLHATGNYHGFRYLHQDEVPYKEKPGIRFPSELPEVHSFADTDPTRIQYL